MGDHILGSQLMDLLSVESMKAMKKGKIISTMKQCFIMIQLKMCGKSNNKLTKLMNTFYQIMYDHVMMW